MSIPRKQLVAIAAIVGLGAIVGAAVLMTPRHQADEEAEVATAAPAPAAAAAGHASAPPEHPAHAIRLDAAQARAADIVVQAAGPGSIRTAAQFQGEVRFDEDRLAHVVPRLSGVAQAVPVRLGEAVRKGQLLAVIASTALAQQRSELLAAQRRRAAARTTFERERQLWQDKISAEQDYQQARTALEEADIAVQNARQKLAAIGAGVAMPADERLNQLEIRAPFDGTVVEKHLAPGEAVKEDASIFTVADLRTVWAEFAVAPADLARVRVGQRAVVSSSAFDGRADGSVAYVGDLLGEQTRTARARVALANPQGAWRPGLFVTVAVLGDSQAVPLLVSADALQAVDNRQVLFKAVPGGFVATPVRTGRTDGTNVEILDGIRAGDRVASSNSFILKAELGKASAAQE